MSGWKDYEVIPLRKKYDTTLALTHLRNRIKNDSEFANKIVSSLMEEVEDAIDKAFSEEGPFSEEGSSIQDICMKLVEKIMEIVYGEELQDDE